MIYTQQTKDETGEMGNFSTKNGEAQFWFPWLNAALGETAHGPIVGKSWLEHDCTWQPRS
jgi:hypothetical protein